MNRLFPLFRLSVFCLIALGSTASILLAEGQTPVKPVAEVTGLPTRIAFGSCGKQDKPQPALRQVVGQKPDLFIYLGDNIYGDTRDMNVLKAKYDMLGAKPEFQALRREVAVLSVWDDHDYGENDAGKEYPKKKESREIFFDFWQVPGDSPRRARPGIYGEHTFTENGKTLQVILLDTRFFRDPLKRNSRPIPPDSPFKNEYQPDDNPEKTMLGKDQWQWLEQQFQKPADLRIVCSSIQFGHEYNGWESWTNLPAERQRMLDLIQRSKASGVVFISGDVHWAEISRREMDLPYPLYDVTASGLTEDWHNIEPNRYRVGEAVPDNHFGLIEIDWETDDPLLRLKVIDVKGTTRMNHPVRLSEISFPK
ncbi:MAG: alkaline phosphatase D family protein [Pirellulaceae bacterium]